MRRAALFAVAILACDPLDIRLFPERVEVTPPESVDDLDAAPPAVVTPPDPLQDAAPAATCSLRCQACVENAACDADERCHPLTGQCVAPCGPGQPECPDDEVCNEALGVCVSCTDDVGCTSGDLEICDARQGICVECMDDSHCTDDPQERPRCLAALGVCGCESDADCPSGVCDEDEAHCEEEEEGEN